MARPPQMMRRYAADAHDARLRSIAQTAVDHGITLQMLARSIPPAGVDETAVRRVFEGSKTLDRTVERYAKALIKDGVRILSDYECRRLAGTLTREDMRFVIDCELQEIFSRAQYTEAERDGAALALNLFDNNHLRKIADLVSNFESINLKTAELFEGWKELLGHKMTKLDFAPGRALVVMLISCGVAPRQAILSIKIMLRSLASRGMIHDAESILKEFEGNQLLAQLVNHGDGLGRDLVAYLLGCKRNFERNLKAELS